MSRDVSGEVCFGQISVGIISIFYYLINFCLIRANDFCEKKELKVIETNFWILTVFTVIWKKSRSEFILIKQKARSELIQK